jgi:hypothetical protein
MSFLPLTGTTESSDLGLFGSTYLITPGVYLSGNWSTIKTLTPTVIAVLLSRNSLDGSPMMVNAADGTGTITNLSLAAGITLKGYFGSIQLTSGAVQLHNMTGSFGWVTVPPPPPPPPPATPDVLGTEVTESGEEITIES